MGPQRLKYSEIPAVRDYLLEQQAHRCGLCDEDIDGNAVLDHDHKTGKIRRVLHRGCNAMLGKIENNMARNQITLARLIKFADKIHDYITNTDTDWIHPTYKTPEEKKMAYKKKKKKVPGKKY